MSNEELPKFKTETKEAWSAAAGSGVTFSLAGIAFRSKPGKDTGAALGAATLKLGADVSKAARLTSDDPALSAKLDRMSQQVKEYNEDLKKGFDY